MTDHGDSSEVLLIDGDETWRFMAVGGVINVQNLATFQRKTVIGDYTRDSNPILSTWVLTDLSGGHGVQQLEEGSDAARFRFGVLDTRRPRQMTLPWLDNTVAAPNGDTCYLLGMLRDDFFIAFGTDIYSWDETTQAITDTADNLTTVPVNKPVAYKGKLYIPNGSSFDTYDGATVTNVNTFDAVGFCLWDRRLFGLAEDGQIWQTLDGTNWTNDGDDAKLDESYTIRDMVAYHDASDFPMPMVITDQDLWAFDPSGPELYRTKVQYPRHRDQGLGSAVWRGELFTSVGMGVFRYNGSTLSAMGLDRDQGLPSGIRGKIVDLLDGYNGMYALVSGGEFLDTSTEDEVFDATDDEWYVSSSSAVSSLHVYTGYGWLCYWTSGDATGLPTWMTTSAQGDGYRLWYGVGSDAKHMKLPIDFANARALVESGTGEFAPAGYVETGMFDAGLTSYTKIANSILVRTDGTTSTSTISVSYRISEEDGFTLLGVVTEPGETLFSIGGYPGLAFKTIEFRYDFTRDPDNVSAAPIMSSSVFSYLKIIPSYHSLVVKVDLNAPVSGQSPAAMKAKIEELIAAPRFFKLKEGDTEYRVRIAQGGGAEYVGFGDDRADYTLNFIEIKEDL